MSDSIDIVKFFFEMLNNVKLFHWQTTSYAAHKATDELHAVIEQLSDKFLEILQGKKNKRVGFGYGKGDSANLMLVQMTPDKFVAYLQACCFWLMDIQNKGVVSATDLDLLNLRDEMVGAINQTLYLLSFK